MVDLGFELGGLQETVPELCWSSVEWLAGIDDPAAADAVVVAVVAAVPVAVGLAVVVVDSVAVVEETESVVGVVAAAAAVGVVGMTSHDSVVASMGVAFLVPFLVAFLGGASHIVVTLGSFSLGWAFGWLSYGDVGTHMVN